jgi:cobalt-zinc-cadmium efflux system membrane fusion protein
MKRLVLIASVALPLAACGGSPPPPDSTAAAAAPKAGYFEVPEAQRPHLQVVAAQSTTWTKSIGLTGTVDWDNDHTAQAITQVSGPITRLLVDTGSHVKVGDPLLEVASPDVTNAVSTYRKAKNRVDLAKRVYDRDKDLLDHKAIAQRDLDDAQADYNDAQTDVENSLQALKIFGVDKEDLDAAEKQGVAIQPVLAMRAPIAGTVVQKMVLPGQVIQAGSTVAFVISDVSTVWVQGHLDEKDLSTIHNGDLVDVHTAAYPDPFKGTVTYIGDMLDPATRTTPVRIVTANPGGKLRKDQFVDITIRDKAKRDVLAVPTAAVLFDEQNFPFVYLQMEPGQFAQRAVKTGATQGDQIEITDGLKAGDRVVAQGSIFLQFARSSQ